MAQADRQPTSARRWMWQPGVAVIGGVIALVAGSAACRTSIRRAWTPMSMLVPRHPSMHRPHSGSIVGDLVDAPHAPTTIGTSATRWRGRAEAGIRAKGRRHRGECARRCEHVAVGRRCGHDGNVEASHRRNGEEKLLVLRELDVNLGTQLARVPSDRHGRTPASCSRTSSCSRSTCSDSRRTEKSTSFLRGRQFRPPSFICS